MSEYMATILPIYAKDNSEKVNIYARAIACELTGGDVEVPVQGEYFRAIV